jgi:uncharacterized protein YbjT (DUF2867 family)
MGLEILVLGATGRFSPLVGRLLNRGHHVRAASREPDSPRSAALRGLGAAVVPVDLDDPASIERAARAADAIFFAGTLHAAGPAVDARHGGAVVAAAAAASMRHLVFVSVAGADRPSNVPAFESKRLVEDRLRESAVPHTILAPVYLMENLWNPWNLPVLHAGRLPSPIRPELPLHQVALSDIIVFAAHVLGRRADFLGRRIEIASDRLSALEAAATLGELLGRQPEVELQNAVGPAPLFDWLDRVGYTTDVEELRRRFPEIGWHRYRDWARRQDWSPLTEP